MSDYQKERLPKNRKERFEKKPLPEDKPNDKPSSGKTISDEWGFEV